MFVFLIVLLIPAIFFIARGIQDVRDRRYGWATAGVISGVLTLVFPIVFGAMSFDMPG